MSRRSRRRGQQGRKGWLGKALLILTAVILIAVGVGHVLLRGFLHSDAFRKFLSAQVSRAAGVTGEFSPFQWDGLAVRTQGFSGEGEGAVRSLRAEGIGTSIDLGGVKRGVWLLEDAVVNRLDVEVDARRRPREIEPEPEVRENIRKVERRRWLPSEVELRDLHVKHGSARIELEDGRAEILGMEMKLDREKAQASYTALLENGSLRLPGGRLPEIQLERARLRFQDGTLHVTEATAGVWGGKVTLNGVWDREAEERGVFQGSLRDVAADRALPENWAKRISGRIRSDFVFRDGRNGQSTAGDVALEDGVVTALPVLDALAAYADTRRFRTLSLTTASAQWRREGDLVRFDRIVLASEGLLKLQGSLEILDGRLNGDFLLGLAPGTLAGIPGAETVVFAPGDDGLLWAPLKVTGTLEKPKEDLTERLIAAAGMRLIEQLPETGQEVLRMGEEILGESSAETIGKGARIISEGADAVREVGGLLDGFLGRKRAKKDDE